MNIPLISLKEKCICCFIGHVCGIFLFCCFMPCVQQVYHNFAQPVQRLSLSILSDEGDFMRQIAAMKG